MYTCTRNSFAIIQWHMYMYIHVYNVHVHSIFHTGVYHIFIIFLFNIMRFQELS